MRPRRKTTTARDQLLLVSAYALIAAKADHAMRGRTRGSDDNERLTCPRQVLREVYCELSLDNDCTSSHVGSGISSQQLLSIGSQTYAYSKLSTSSYCDNEKTTTCLHGRYSLRGDYQRGAEHQEIPIEQEESRGAGEPALPEHVYLLPEGYGVLVEDECCYRSVGQTQPLQHHPKLT